MKKKSKIILVALVLIISLILIYCIYQNIKESIINQELSKKLNEVVTAHATGIVVAKERDNHDNKDITHITLKEREDSTKMSYRFGIASNTTIKNINGEETQVSELNLGDKIYITYETRKEINLIYTFPPSLDNIKSIEVIEDNSDNHLTEDDLSYNNFETGIFKFEKNNISFQINFLQKTPDEFSSTMCKILKSEDGETKNTKAIFSIGSSEIFYKKLSNDLVEININVPDLTKKLEIGENYIFRFENEEIGLIKFYFSITESNVFQCYY